ncbi:MAG TPA: DUF3108 domain-containing protein, partial [Stellaceae bacterium]
VSALVLAAVSSAAPAETPAPLKLCYEASASGLPILALDFTITETAAAYEIAAGSRASGMLGWFSDYAMRGESRGTIAAGKLRPSMHENSSRSRHRERRAHLDYAGDDTILTALSPERPDHLPPTTQQIAGTVDPLTALLAISRAVARVGHCGGVGIAVYDGRRRYDLALADAGAERSPPSPDAPAGEVRRCSFALTKIAGFSSDRDDKPRTEHGRVWLPPPRAGVPLLPQRVDFPSDWGAITVRLAQPGSAK